MIRRTARARRTPDGRGGAPRGVPTGCRGTPRARTRPPRPNPRPLLPRRGARTRRRRAFPGDATTRAPLGKDPRHDRSIPSRIRGGARGETRTPGGSPSTISRRRRPRRGPRRRRWRRSWRRRAYAWRRRRIAPRRSRAPPRRFPWSGPGNRARRGWDCTTDRGCGGAGRAHGVAAERSEGAGRGTGGSRRRRLSPPPRNASNPGDTIRRGGAQSHAGSPRRGGTQTVRGVPARCEREKVRFRRRRAATISTTIVHLAV